MVVIKLDKLIYDHLKKLILHNLRQQVYLPNLLIFIPESRTNGSAKYISNLSYIFIFFTPSENMIWNYITQVPENNWIRLIGKP